MLNHTNYTGCVKHCDVSQVWLPGINPFTSISSESITRRQQRQIDVFAWHPHVSYAFNNDVSQKTLCTTFTLVPIRMLTPAKNETWSPPATNARSTLQPLRLIRSHKTCQITDRTHLCLTYGRLRFESSQSYSISQDDRTDIKGRSIRDSRHLNTPKKKDTISFSESHHWLDINMNGGKSTVNQT